MLTLMHVNYKHHHNEQHNKYDFETPKDVFELSKVLKSCQCLCERVVTTASITFTGNMLIMITRARKSVIQTAGSMFCPTGQLKNDRPSS